MTTYLDFKELSNKKIPCIDCGWMREIEIEYVDKKYGLGGGHKIRCNGHSGVEYRTIDIPYFIDFSCGLYDKEEKWKRHRRGILSEGDNERRSERY